MTTAKSRRPATAAGPQRGASAKKSGRSHEPIPVLIRLPELHLEPESAEEDGFTEDASSTTIPLKAAPLESAPLESGPPPGSQAQVPQPGASAVGGRESVAAAGWPSFSGRLPSWSEFRVPRPALRGGIALGLVAVLVIAFLAISGPPPKPGPPVAQGKGAPAVELPAPSTEGVPPAGPPAQVGLAAPPAIDTAAGSAASAAPAKDAAKQKEDSTEEAPAAAATGGGGDDNKQSPVDVAPSGEPPAAPAPAPEQPEATALQQATATAAQERPPAPASAPDAGNPPSAPVPADTGPLLPSEAASGEPGAAGEAYRYPVTNPATFQYPVDYHERLLPRVPSLGAQGVPPAPSGAGLSDRSPSTARLQPPIEPPPVR